MGETVNIDDDLHRWRWTCPNGHRSWEPTNNHFWCQQCSRLHGENADFEELHDTRTGKTFHRDELELVTDWGSYHDVYGEGGAP